MYIYTIQYIPFVSCITCQALTGRRLPPRPRRAKRPSWAWRQRPGGTVDPWEKPWKMLGKTMENSGKTMENSGKTMENAGENGEKWILSLRNLIFLAMNNWYVARFFCKWWSAALPAWKLHPDHLQCASSAMHPSNGSPNDITGCSHREKIGTHHLPRADLLPRSYPISRESHGQCMVWFGCAFLITVSCKIQSGWWLIDTPFPQQILSRSKPGQLGRDSK